MEGPKKEKKRKKKCFLSFIRFAVDMGTVCCDLPPQSEAVCHHVDSGNQEEKRPADYPLTGFQKIGCLQREGRQFKKCLMGFQIEQNVRVPLQLLPRSRSTATSPCPHTEMR